MQCTTSGQIMIKHLLHPDFETLSAAAIRQHQDVLWSEQMPSVMARSAFYAEKFVGAPPSTSLDGLQDLPLTDKDELRLSQQTSYPFGAYAACPHDTIVRVHRTSGTTGRPLQLAHGRRDVDLIARIGGRSQFSAGLRPGDRVVHCLNYCMWTGGVTDHMTLEEAGAAVVPFGVGNTKLLLTTIAELAVNAISCTPSYPALLEKIIRAEGRKPRELGLRIGLFGGEAGLDNTEFRTIMENTWGFAVRNANYGVSEILSNFASQCEDCTDLHFHGGDGIFVEILDSAGNRLEVKEGTTGELVATHLAKQCQPLVRFRTRDVITITGTGPCNCGRTTWRFRVIGRTDDMFNVRGINVFPGAVQNGILSRPDLASGQFRIMLEGSGPWDRIRVRVEAASTLVPELFLAAKLELEAAIQLHAGASAEVVIVAADCLPRTDGKTAVIERS